MAKNGLMEAQDLDSALKVFVSYGHNLALGYEVLGHGAGWIDFRLPWRRDLTADPDEEIIAPGAIYSLLDTACALTTWAKRGYFTVNPTLDLRVDFLRPPKPRASLVARGECERITGDVAYMRGLVHDGDPDDPVAQCVGTFIVVEPRQ
jgi:acyl-coenzyme A thioesterase PaaI-like protein